MDGRARVIERAALLSQAAELAAAYAAAYAVTAQHRSVFPTDASIAALAGFEEPFPAGPTPAADVIARLDSVGSPGTVITNAGRYFGFVTGGTDPAAQAAAILAGAWDQNSATPVMSPVASRIGQVTGSWVLDALGLAPTAAVSFTTGASEGNLTAIITARDSLLAGVGWDVATKGTAGSPPLRVVTGAETHVSVLKALRLAGFGSDQIDLVPVDHAGAILADAFPTDTDERTLVVLQAGNVNTGASDPFAQIVPGVRARGGWVHVDGAFGLWAAASPSRAHLVAGVDQADSWATDAHKWLNVPYDSGILMVRDPDLLRDAMSTVAAYLPPSAQPTAMGSGLRMSQNARAIPVWAMLASHGRTGLAEMIDLTCDLAVLLRDRLVEGGATSLNEVMLNQALIAFPDAAGLPSDAVTDATIAGFQSSGIGWAGGTTWQGRRAMRLSVSDAATRTHHIDDAASAILAAWHAARG